MTIPRAVGLAIAGAVIVAASAFWGAQAGSPNERYEFRSCELGPSGLRQGYSVAVCIVLDRRTGDVGVRMTAVNARASMESAALLETVRRAAREARERAAAARDTGQ